MEYLLMIADAGVLMCLVAAFLGACMFLYGAYLSQLMGWKTSSDKIKTTISVLVGAWMASSAVYGIGVVFFRFYCR